MQSYYQHVQNDANAVLSENALDASCFLFHKSLKEESQSLLSQEPVVLPSSIIMSSCLQLYLVDDSFYI